MKQCKYAVFTEEKGVRHREEGKDSEDSVLIIEGKDFCFYGLADGQSGKKYSKTGGKEVLGGIAQYLKKKKISQLYKYQYWDEIQYELVRVIRNILDKLSEQYGEDKSQFSSTIVAYAFDPNTKESISIHLGDGAIIGIDSLNEIEMISSPENGITNQYTWLTTAADIMSHIRVRKVSKEYQRVVLVTDGTTSICHGRNISYKAMEHLSIQNFKKDIISYIKEKTYWDDASCIVIDF